MAARSWRFDSSRVHHRSLLAALVASSGCALRFIGVKLSDPFFDLFQHVFLDVEHRLALGLQAFKRGQS